MKKLLLVIWLACLAVVVTPAHGQVIGNTNNTIVRLNVTVNGTNFGSIDLELFDQEKPETVRNFLMYVYSGGYSNMIIHGLFPGQVLRTGHVLPDGTNQLSTTVERVQSFGTIGNEFHTGPVLENRFGTIALVPTNWHGAAAIGSMDWVINLTNNASFNAANPYVVFGHVVNTAGPLTGTNLLHYFNTFRLGTNIRGVSIGFPATEEMYIPVTRYESQRFPNTAEMYLITASVIQAGVPRDAVAPTVQITQPAGNSTNETVGAMLFAGTAGDNQRVARVIYDYGYPYQRFTANGTVNWSSNVFLFPSTNTVTFRSVDDFGNVSAPISRTVYYPFVTVNLNTNGNAKGRVTGLTNGQTIRLGETYRLEARPARGKYFLGWVNDAFFSQSRVIDFNIPPEFWFATNLTAYFARTFLGLSNGTYQGIFYPLTNGPNRSAGWISLKLAPNGQYFGVLNPAGARYQIRGQFDGSGLSSIIGYRGTSQLALTLSLTDDPAAEQIVGEYQEVGGFVSRVVLFRVQKYLSTAPARQAGQYSFLISPTTDTSTVTGDGYGFGSATIDASGRIRMLGTLGDEMAIKQNAKLLKYDYWPFYALANGGREAILGWARLNGSNSFTADIKWWAPHFPGDTNQNSWLSGARFSSDTRVVNWTNGVLTFTGGGLAQPLSSDVTLNEDGSITVLSNTNDVQLGFADGKGQFNGTFKHPVTGLITPMRGGGLQSSNIIGGFFGEGTENGGFVIRRKP